MTIKASMSDEQIIAELSKVDWQADVVYEEDNWTSEDPEEDDMDEDEYDGETFGKSMDADIEIAKTDEKKGLVFGWASVIKKDGKTVVDRQGDVIESDWEMEKAAYDFTMSSRVGGEEHVRKGVSTLIESMAFTDEKIEALGLPDDFPRGWWVGFKITDKDVMKGMKEGKYTGFSVHGRGKRTPIKKKADEMSFNDMREIVNNALKIMYPTSPLPGYSTWTYISDMSSSWVVYSVEQGGKSTYYKADWSCDKDGVCTISDPVEVRSKTTYVKKGNYDQDRVQAVLSRARKATSAGERKTR
jgi:hypothetical protein